MTINCSSVPTRRTRRDCVFVCMVIKQGSGLLWNERGDTYNQEFILSVQPTRVMIEDVYHSGKRLNIRSRDRLRTSAPLNSDHLDCETVQPRSWRSVLGVEP